MRWLVFAGPLFALAVLTFACGDDSLARFEGEWEQSDETEYSAVSFEGAAHCVQDGLIILRLYHPSLSPWASFIRDADGQEAEPFTVVEALPEDALSAGLQNGDLELFFSAGLDAVYVQDDGELERWLAYDSDFGCD